MGLIPLKINENPFRLFITPTHLYHLFLNVFKEQAFEFISFKVTSQNLSFQLHLFATLETLKNEILKEKLTIDDGILMDDIYYGNMFRIFGLYEILCYKLLS